MRIERDGEKWHWYTGCTGGIIGNYYEPSKTWIGALIDYIIWEIQWHLRK